MAGKYTGFDKLSDVAKSAAVSSPGAITTYVGRRKAQRSFGPTMGGSGNGTLLNQDRNNSRYGQRYRETQKMVDGVLHLVHDYGGTHVDMGPLKGRGRSTTAGSAPVVQPLSPQTRQRAAQPLPARTRLRM